MTLYHVHFFFIPLGLRRTRRTFFQRAAGRTNAVFQKGKKTKKTRTQLPRRKYAYVIFDYKFTSTMADEKYHSPVNYVTVYRIRLLLLLFLSSSYIAAAHATELFYLRGRVYSLIAFYTVSSYVGHVYTGGKIDLWNDFVSFHYFLLS